MKQFKAPITSIIEAMPGIYLVRLEAPDIAGAARPGQFLMVRCYEDTILPAPLASTGSMAASWRFFSRPSARARTGCHSGKGEIPWISSGLWAMALPSIRTPEICCWLPAGWASLHCASWRMPLRGREKGDSHHGLPLPRLPPADITFPEFVQSGIDALQCPHRQCHRRRLGGV